MQGVGVQNRAADHPLSHIEWSPPSTEKYKGHARHESPKYRRKCAGHHQNTGSSLAWVLGSTNGSCDIYMSHFSYSCKMQYPLNLVLDNWEYLWFYWTFWIVILDCGLKLHKLSIHTLVMLQKLLEIYKIIVWSSHCVLFSAIFATEKFRKKFQHGQ